MTPGCAISDSPPLSATSTRYLRGLDPEREAATRARGRALALTGIDVDDLDHATRQCVAALRATDGPADRAACPHRVTRSLSALNSRSATTCPNQKKRGCDQTERRCRAGCDHRGLSGCKHDARGMANGTWAMAGAGFNVQRSACGCRVQRCSVRCATAVQGSRYLGGAWCSLFEVVQPVWATRAGPLEPTAEMASEAPITAARTPPPRPDRRRNVRARRGRTCCGRFWGSTRGSRLNTRADG